MWEGRSNGIGNHPGQKCKGELSRRHIWDREHNREGSTGREGRVCIGASHLLGCCLPN